MSSLTPSAVGRRRGPAWVGGLVGLSLLATACVGGDDPEPEPTTPSGAPAVAGLAVGADSVTVMAAGDIARKPEDGVGTAALIRDEEPDAVLALGDTAYDAATAEEFKENYTPTWGKFRAITRPIPGNHEYKTPGASGYFRYFRKQIHGRPYYAWDIGRWRAYALNCDIDCGRDSKQLQWLAKDLAKNAGRPMFAAVHEPFFTCSTRHPPARRLDDLWTALDEAGASFVLSGNNHAYERFAPMDVDGQITDSGMRQFVVGTGGATLYPLSEPCPSREDGTDSFEGVLKLELTEDSYTWEFISVGGDMLDYGRTRVG